MLKIKIFGITISILLVAIITPVNYAISLSTTTENTSDISDSLNGRYFCCYVNSSGTYINLSKSGTWFRPNDFTFARKLFVQYTENASTTIYRTKNGAELDYIEGTHELKIRFFIGFLDYKAHKRVSLHGIAITSSINQLQKRYN